MKCCTGCGEGKELNEFHVQSSRPDGHRSICKACTLKTKKERKGDAEAELNRLIRSSIITENRLLAPLGKKLCSKCHRPSGRLELLIYGECDACIEDNKIKGGKNDR
jgi:uncharacterized protein (DUF983 family)